MTSAVVIQGRVIGALVLREARARYGRTQIGYLWALAQPATHVILLSIIFTALGKHAPQIGNNLAVFFATGIIPYLLYKNTSNRLASAFDANRVLFTYPIVKEVDALIARAALEFATTILIMIIIFYILIVATGAPPPARIWSMIGALFGLSLLGFGMGTIFAVMRGQFRAFQNIQSLTSRPLYMISGIFFTLESLPTQLREAVAWNPIIHGVEWLRHGYFLNYHSNSLDINYLLGWGLVTTFIGLAAERALRVRRLR